MLRSALPEERWGDRCAGHTCPGWGGGFFSDNSSSPFTCTHCLSLPIRGYSFSRQSVASPPHAQLHAHCPTLPRARGLVLQRPAPHLLLDLTPRRHLRLNVQTGLSTPQTCPSCRAPLLAKAPGCTHQNAELSLVPLCPLSCTTFFYTFQNPFSLPLTPLPITSLSAASRTSAIFLPHPQFLL